ncbi:hypothetical protein SAMN04488029_2697 [Reichenbachiella faecimaris]|uniref:Uncharacterized protein n=1 Tax=Reichenbachiella faecimaris TaxID=692418 RepID=A0A1W2GHC8_REIFA|nr:hypothetical protein [Reichenbachiella faecimaris]SMD36073.1 hypothetical protein SAMN04488029_2697 [Reichenbachiella faecimaris]
MHYHINNFREDAYIITTEKDQYFFPAPIFEGLLHFAQKHGYHSTNYDKLFDTFYYGKDELTGRTDFAIGTRWWFGQEALNLWKSILLEQRDSLGFVMHQNAQFKSKFQSFTAKGYSLPFNPCFVDLTKLESCGLMDFQQLQIDICRLAASMASNDDCAIKQTDSVIIDNAVIDSQNKIQFSKGRRRKCGGEKELNISSELFDAFIQIISQGECKIDQIRFHIKLKGRNSSEKVAEENIYGLETIDYPGGRAYLFEL